MVDGRTYTRSTGAMTESGAWDGLRCYKAQMELRGEPSRVTCFADR